MSTRNPTGAPGTTEWEEKHDPISHALFKVTTHMRKVEGDDLWRFHHMRKLEDLWRDVLLPRTKREPGEEANHSVEAKVPALDKMDVLAMFS